MQQPENITAMIRAAFADTPAPPMTIGQLADLRHGPKPDAAIHQAIHWSEVTADLLKDGHAGSCETILVWATDEVWAHYMPALMVGALQHIDSTRGITMALPVLTMISPVPPDYAEEEDYRGRVALFSAEQVIALQQFVRLCLTKDLWWSIPTLAPLKPRLVQDWAVSN